MRHQSESVTPENLIERLSPRRSEVLELVAKGLTNDDMAHVLHISPGTVRIHVASLLAELQVANRTEAAAAYFEWKASTTHVAQVLARPAIAVLSLESLDRTKKSQLRAASVTQDLTTLFARWCWFPVIAATYARSTLGATQSSRELGRSIGARFLVRGSLRGAGAVWRLGIRLEDSEDGCCLWAENFEFLSSELFDVQDSVCERIVATAYDVLVKGIATRLVTGRHPEGLNAWGLAHKGMLLHAARAPESNAQARTCFSTALERDPNLVLGHFGLGLCHYDAILNQWSPDSSSADRLLKSALRCMELAPHAAEGYFLVGRHFQVLGKHVDALPSLEMAVARNPSAAIAHALIGQILAISGRFDEGLTRMRHASRLSPRSFVAGLAALHFIRNENQETLEHAERALVIRPDYAFARVLATAGAYWLGDVECAKKHARVLRLQHPTFSPDNFVSTFGGVHGWAERIARALAATG
jgi:TolB-like protein